MILDSGFDFENTPLSGQASFNCAIQYPDKKRMQHRVIGLLPAPSPPRKARKKGKKPKHV